MTKKNDAGDFFAALENKDKVAKAKAEQKAKEGVTSFSGGEAKSVQLSITMPETAKKELDRYLMRRGLETGETRIMAGFVRDAIAEKMAREPY